LIQPQALGVPPPSSIAAQSRSTSAWSSQRIMKETASVNGNCGPPFRPEYLCPASVNSTTSTSPLLVEGLSAGERITWSTRLSGSSVT
jgi:hypothetical protein